jgi:acetone carboxylase alpha subunit
MAYTRDTEVVQRMKPEPMTQAEIDAQADIDDLDFEIFQHKMNMIALEGKETTMKLGASTGMRWGDVAFGIYTGLGDLSVVATGIWFHAVLGQIPVKYIVKHWLNDETVGVKPGDSFFFNDPFYAGVHAADMGLCVPIFADGELICFAGANVHTGENGAAEPGGQPIAAKSRYEEGLMVPPIKVGENYTLREDLMTMIGTATRDPRTMVLDIKARLAACRIAERRIQEIVKEKGVKFFRGALRKILSTTAKAARKKVSQLHDGVYRQPRFIDIVGSEEKLLRIGINLEKKGDKLKLTFDGVSPMLDGHPQNTFFQGIIGLAMVYFCGWFFYDLPANNALLEAVDWEFPEKTIINASGDAPTALAPSIQTCFVHGIFLIGARMTYNLDPKRAVASWFSGFGIPYFGGFNQWEEPVADISSEINATGAGARPDQDGVNGAGAFFATMSDCSDVETNEADRPFLYIFRNYYKHSYGAGKYRGGAGVGFGWAIHHVPWLAMGGLGYGSKYPATLGIFGGYAVPPGFIQTVHGSDVKKHLADSDRSLPVNFDQLYEEGNPEKGNRALHNITMGIQPFLNGDTFYMPAGGGAGYGDVLERDPKAVMDDLREGLVSQWIAENLYKVAFDAETLMVDIEATKKLRDKAFEERKAKGVPLDEFEETWSKEQPPRDILTYYGGYPYPKPKMDFGLPM